MKDPTNDQVAELAAALDRLSRRFKLSDASLGGRPLAEIDKHILQHVAAQPGCGPSDVARAFGIALTTISSATDRLAKRGLLQRLRPSDDRRAVALQLTDEGVAYAEAQRAAHQTMFRAMLDQLLPEERPVFIGLIGKISSSED
ncbi:MarR family winged helix-turn-helix transcriptional regulator [Salipiger marinus]|jgi:DNA-binding MarR family transcriptional regulator|uniref:MarR family protein n=1 Tax=Salipiger marinus TaxID=555512 RepID=A0A1G8KB07_9RHOB|nr:MULTISPECIES: MarR family transcriptional regulator [Salipiger]HBM60173.1 MarR family transcriptional regulator [Citreicella sp.]MCD1618642.1 MarR family transcriptional regulator [Salipiger manganoxidans]MEB3417630.1 MarR family transcriptional regulator [Salipiger manganoxidans]SDI40602.1 MarR family protein [Salipiger marinus]HBS99690.1 MarR family transcriptional regulator [Citreicella sp.]